MRKRSLSLLSIPTCFASLQVAPDGGDRGLVSGSLGLSILTNAYTDACSIENSSNPTPELWDDIKNQIQLGIQAHGLIDKVQSFYRSKLDQAETGLRITGHPKLLVFPTVIRPSIPPEFKLRVRKNQYSKVRDMLNLQYASDSAYPYSRPYLMYDGELVPSDTGTTIYRIGEALSKRTEATIFDIRDPVGFVIKYQSNCRSFDREMIDVQRDYGFLKVVEEIGKKNGVKIAHRAVWLSPPVKLDQRFKSPKADFETDYQRCAANPDSYVRYMIMEKAPVLLLEDIIAKSHLTKLDRLKLGLQLGIQLIPKLELIHMAGIIHGDIQPGNIVQFKGISGDAGSLEFGLIDFGISFYEGELISRECQYPNRCETVHEPSWHNPCWLSFWNLQGSRLAYRDDVFNTLFMSATVMNGLSVLLKCDLAKAPEMIHWKKNTFFFDYLRDVVAEALPETSPIIRAHIRKRMELALAEARNVNDPTEKPNYGAIVAALESAYKLVVDPNSADNDASGDEQVEWSAAKLLEGDLAIPWEDRPEDCENQNLPHYYEFEKFGKVTFPMNCQEGYICKSISPPNGRIKYSRTTERQRRLQSHFPDLSSPPLRPINADEIVTRCIDFEDGNIKSLYEIKQLSGNQAASMVIKTIEILEKVHKIGAVLEGNPYFAFCITNLRVKSLELCSLSGALELYVNPNTHEFLEGKSPFDDLSKIIEFMEQLASKISNNESKRELKSAAQKIKILMASMTRPETFPYASVISILEPIASGYVDPPEPVFEKVSEFLPLQPIQGFVDTSAALILHQAINDRVFFGSERDHPEECPTNREYTIGGNTVYKFTQCQPTSNLCISDISDDFRMGATRLSDSDHTDLVIRETYVATKLADFEILSVRQPPPENTDYACKISPRYDKLGGTRLDLISIKTFKATAPSIIYKMMRFIWNIHYHGLVTSVSPGKAFVAFITSKGRVLRIAIRNPATDLSVFVDPTTGEHTKTGPTRKSTLLGTLNILLEKSIRAGIRQDLIDYLNNMIQSVSAIGDLDQPDYDLLINTIPI